jgi:hypothetical protein
MRIINETQHNTNITHLNEKNRRKIKQKITYFNISKHILYVGKYASNEQITLFFDKFMK